MKIQEIICIDDDAITLMLSRKVLQKTNEELHVVTFQNGEVALNYLQTIQQENKQLDHRLVLLDLNMPVMGGWEFLNYFLENGLHVEFPNTQMIILSSTIDPQDVLRAKQYPMVARFLSKPISRPIMQSLLEELEAAASPRVLKP
ncbi:MAG: response regulator [Flavobacterium sp. BFFFF2]|nr:MAG: response regulator [Flavobacterium sp. BFFFF2]